MTNVSIKWLHEGEFRRFGMTLPETGALAALNAKVAAMLPGFNASLAWKDSDGDLIVFSTDEELREGLRSMSDGVLRLFSVPRKAQAPAQTQAPTIAPAVPQAKPMEETTDAADPNAPKLHPGVVCDGCEKPIMGYRFKCVMCPDYDLCMDCHQTGQHKEHAMIRIADPADVSWRAALLPPWMMGGHGHPWGGRGHHGRRGFGRRHCPFTAAPGPQPPQPNATNAQPNHPPPDFSQVANAGAQFLQQVAAALTNLGIDVDVDVKNPETGNTTHAGPTQTTTTTTTKTTTDKEATPAAEGPVRSASDDWTMVPQPQPMEDDGITVTKVLNAASNTANVNAAASAPPQAAGLYPTVPAATAPVPPSAMHHPDPAIHHAVEHMLAMGFKNEGGWLTQLLELKKGNISAALDALAPHGHVHRPQ